MKKKLAVPLLLAGLLGAGLAQAADPYAKFKEYYKPLPAIAPIPADNPQTEAKVELGKMLYFDARLSGDGTIACATCHNPDAGFADPRETEAGRAVSLGDDGHSLGDRNAPTASYASFSPPFHRRADGKWVGGQFHDGRAATLADQAKGPPLNPIEMGLADEAAVAARLWENPRYVATLAALKGAEATRDPQLAFEAMGELLPHPVGIEVIRMDSAIMIESQNSEGPCAG